MGGSPGRFPPLVPGQVEAERSGWRSTSLKLADQVRYGEDVEKAAQGLLKSAIGQQ